MIWKPAKDPKHGWAQPGVMESDAGYIIACISMAVKEEPPYCYTLAKPGRLIEVIRNVSGDREERRIVYAKLRKMAEADLSGAAKP